MKKVWFISFLSMYLLATVGVTLAVHFCGGKVTSAQILPFVAKEDPCGCDDSTSPDDCCKTEIKTIQLINEQIAVHIDQSSSPQTDVTLWAEPSAGILLSSEAVCVAVPTSSPPNSPPLYILNSVFLI